MISHLSLHTVAISAEDDDQYEYEWQVTRYLHLWQHVCHPQQILHHIIIKIVSDGVFPQHENILFVVNSEASNSPPTSIYVKQDWDNKKRFSKFNFNLLTEIAAKICQSSSTQEE